MKCGWSLRASRQTLGHYDAAHHTIVLNKILDSESTPPLAVEFVMYHEMLHVKHKPRIINGRRIFHTPAFRTEEKRFAYYEEAIAWLERLSHRR